MKKYIFRISIFFIIISTSCSKDFLNKTPSDMLSSDTFFTQEKDLIFATNACYAALGNSTTLLKIEVATDNSYDGHSWNSLYNMAKGVSNPYDGYSTYYWNERYKGIQRVNRALEGAENIPNLNADVKAEQTAQLRFLRAYFYFDLTYLFGDVPYFDNSVKPDDLNPSGDIPAPAAARMNRNEILKKMVSDLDIAANDLPEDFSGADEGRVTKGAALALKARILLTQASWAKYLGESTDVSFADAAKAAKAVIDLGVYDLNTPYDKAFTYEGIGNSGVIFDLQESLIENQTNYTTQNVGPNSITGWSSGTPLQSLVDSYPMANGKAITDANSGYDPTNPYEGRDPRLAATILYPGHAWPVTEKNGIFNPIPEHNGQKPVYPSDVYPEEGDDVRVSNSTHTGYNWFKYVMLEDYLNGAMWNGSVHLILIRYADVLLMYAEAQAEEGNIAEALDAVNQVRARAGVGALTTLTIEDVRNERRIELAFEGLRLLDIRRWNIAKDVMPGMPKGLVYTYSDGSTYEFLGDGKRIFVDRDNLWPIPQTEVDVSKIKQNPGW